MLLTSFIVIVFLLIQLHDIFTSPQLDHIHDSVFFQRISQSKPL